MTRIDFEARTSRGALIATFADRPHAIAWAAREGENFPGHKLEEVTTTVERRPVRRMPLRLVRAS